MATGLPFIIAQGYLALGIRAQPGQGAVLAQFGLLFHQAVRVVDGGGHEYIGFVSGVTKHQALIAGALLKVSTFALVHAHGDVVGLFTDGVQHGTGGPVKAHIGAVVAYVHE